MSTREITVPAATCTVVHAGREVAFTFRKYIEDLVSADPGWTEGSNDEAGARIAVLVRLLDALDGDPVTVRLSGDDHEVLSKRARACQAAYGPDSDFAPFNAKKAKHLLAILQAKQVD
jgi:hypothetical protein